MAIQVTQGVMGHAPLGSVSTSIGGAGTVKPVVARDVRALSMSRLLLLSILVLWMCPQDNVADPHWASGRVRVGLFVGVYGGLVILMSAWSRLLARRVGGEHLG